ncbi:beta-galactosidase [Cohnella silvisoli]|uniref:Beta-galactosidase n=1 Tax=Cohnella silvisoli TaxID=2873699 RepID=A0ABV1KUM1_9BACL|nr:beta-galactosidase [Cohnella silvisoli]MCD9023139.1 beta-galactosidase [Cohnella silvisoli]
MYFGACYYAEQWPEERWERDISLMREAGFNLVRLTEFAWNKIERSEGQFTFDWLDRLIEMFGSAGIQVILGTPTASPPKWIMDRHPDMYKRDMYGHVRGFGTRMHYCFNNADYPSYIRKLVGAMTERYKNNANVIGWQIDNEFGCVDTTWCYCDTCKAAFQGWLKRKYSTIDALNESWGTVVWNNMYNSFEEIETPKLTVYQLHNPGYQLDFRRFSSEAVCRFQDIQIGIIRSAAPHQKITHNMMGTFNEIDYYKLAKPLDISGLDVYANFPDNEPINPYTPALHHDMTRGFKQANYWVLEHQSGTPGAHILKVTPKPGELRRWTYQSIAHGADALLYFRWRTAVAGAEQHWHGILQHSGVPGRKYDEVRQVGAELAKLAPHLDGSIVCNQAAIIRCFDNDWVFDIQPHNPGYKYLRQVKNYHRYFIEKHTGVDVVSPTADFTKYNFIILPHLALVDDALADKIYRYVEIGGTVVMDFRAGAKLPDNRMRSEVLPGPFKKLLGIEIDDYGIIPEGESQQLQFLDGKGVSSAGYASSIWYDVVDNKTAEVVAEFTSDYFAECPAVTCNAYGKGKAYYIATELDASARTRLLDRICKETGALPEWNVDHPLVEVTVRRREEQNIYFVLNHSNDLVSFTPPTGSVNLFTDEPLATEVELEPNGVLVFSNSLV